MSVSNIDDMLMSGKTATQPAAPEHQYEEDSVPTDESEGNAYDIEPETKEDDNTSGDDDDAQDNDEREAAVSQEVDEYGNNTESMTDGMKKRLKKQADNIHNQYRQELDNLKSQIAQLTPQQQASIQSEVRGFEQDPHSDESWEQQLNAHIEKAVINMQTKQQRAAIEHQERQIQQEFEKKIVSGIDRFNDFRETIGGLGFEINDHMTNATRALDDPAAFLYAAAKRQPQELERISKLKDPYAQVYEMGRLEERMRKGKASTQAPRPLGRTKDDASIPTPKSKGDDSIEDLIAKNDSKKLARIRGNQSYLGR